MTEFSSQGLSVVLTTHLLEEAEKADQIAILSKGQVIAEGAPDALRSQMGAGLITITPEQPDAVCQRLAERLQIDGQSLSNQVRIQSDDPGPLVPQLLSVLGADATSISVGRPSLEDLFIEKTGYQFWSEQ